MKNILKNLKTHWKAIILLIILLIGQAYCDLSLPQYTQDIIDVGIQNRGIHHIMPIKMTAEEYHSGMLFMNDPEKNAWEKSYRKEGKFYTRKSMDEEELDKMDSSLMTPVVLTYQLGHTSIKDFKKIIKENLSRNIAAMDKKIRSTERETNDMEKSPYSKAGVSESSAALLSLKGKRDAQKKLLDRIDTMSVQEISRELNLNIRVIRAKDENGKSKTYVDMREMLQKMIDSGQMNEKSIQDAKKKMNDTIKSVGDFTLRSMGASYAASCEEEAGVNVDRKQTVYLWRCGGKMLVMALFLLLCAVGAAFLASRVGAQVGRDLRNRLFRNVMNFSNAETDRFSSASLITRCTNDVQQVQMVTTILLRMILYAPVLGIWGVIKVMHTGASITWVIALGVLVIVGFVAVLFSVTMPKFRIMQDLVDQLNRVSREILTGMSVIRAFGREKTEEERFDKANTDLMKTQLFTNRVMTLMMPAMILLMNGIVILITWVSAKQIDAGNMQVGAMTAFITYAMMIVMSFLMLSVISIILPRAGVAADRIEEVLKTRSSILDSPEEKAPLPEKAGTGEVVFSHVDFRYPGAMHDVIGDISFTAHAGETTAIIGSTGSGKSTLINLIPRFYDVTGGKITFDGRDVREMGLQDLRSRIGFVPQKGVLFSGSIAYNIRFGRADASDEDVRQAAEIAQAGEFIREKEDGFDSVIAQGGNNVSGGQKQRLAIARALARDPELLVFDDSFSALDMKTDAALRKELSRMEKKTTTIIVAQRISTILHAEQIIVLDEGRIVGKGTHDELMKNCEVYQQIARSQLSNLELEGME